MCLQCLILCLPCEVFSGSPAGKVQEAFLSPDNTYFNILCVDSIWTQPLTLLLSLSLGPALMLPSVLLGTCWPVNFASPRRPSYRPCTQTSQETRTQDGKLPLITSLAWGCNVLWKTDTSQWSLFKSVSCCFEILTTCKLSFWAHFVSIQASVTLNWSNFLT